MCFTKLTDSHSYLLYSSSHPKHTKRWIPFSQFLRLRRLCSEDEDFHSKSLKMRDFFVQRGYPTSFLDTAFSKAPQIPRSEALTNPVTNVTEKNQIPLVLTLHPFNFKVRDIIKKNFHILTNDPETSSIFSNNPLVSFRHSKNIGETLVHSNRHEESSPLIGTFLCEVAQCETCKFIDSSTVILAPKFTYNIKHNFTCTSAHLIYCISCSRVACFTLENWETIWTRFGEHRFAMLTSLLPDILILVVIAFQT